MAVYSYFIIECFYILNVVRQQLEYNPDSTISGAVFNNMYYNYEYNIEGLIKRKSASGKTLLEYTYDKNNNLKTLKDITGKHSKYIVKGSSTHIRSLSKFH